GDVQTIAGGLKTVVAAGTNVASVTKTTVNGKDTYTVNADGTTVSSANSGALTVTPGTKNANNVTDYKVDLGADTKASLGKADNALQSVITQIDGVAVKTITKANNTANFLKGDNILLTDVNGAIKVGLAKDLTGLNSVTMGNTVMNTGGVTFLGSSVQLSSTGLNNGGNQITNVASGGTNTTNAANIGDVQTIAGGLKTVVAAGTNVASVTKTTVNGKDTYTVNADGTTASAGSSAVTVGATNVSGNVTDYKFDLSQASKDSLGKANNSVQYDNALTRDVVTLGGVGSMTPVKLTNVARGEATTDAVNVGQLNEVKQSAADANKGWNLSAQSNESTISTVKPSDTVDLNNTDNNITVSKTAESNNVTFNLSRDIAVDSVQTGDATMNSSGLTIVGGPKLTKTSVDAGGNKITNVANGFIEVASKDAVNGGQLFEVLSSINTQTAVIAEMGAGLNFDADSGPVINKKAGSAPLTFKGGNNITTTSAGSSIKFDLNGNINVDSVTTGDTTVSTNGVVIAGGPSITKAGIYAGNGETAPSMTAAGINAAGTKITNVADGMQPRDAVNFGQLDAVNRNLGNSINELGYRIGEVEDDANAGISAAMAMSSLPQAYIIGKSMIGGGIATYNGESAVAIGFSKLSADGRWVMKLNGTADTQGNVGAAIGAGFHFD
ncbi:hypothetical protein FQ082_00005, partial [Psychrobacter sp. ANT_H56B]